MKRSLAHRVKPARWPAGALACLGLACLAWVQPAAAHDTWLAPRGAPRADGVRLLLGTGERFPLMQTSVGRVPRVQAGCRFGAGEPVPLRAGRDLPEALPLAAEGDARGAWSCWAQLAAQEVELSEVQVQHYLDEVRADAAVRGAWRAQQAQGLPWRERFTKHARFEGQGGSGSGALPLAMDLVPRQLPRRPGERLQVQWLRQGQPVARLALELVNAGAGQGLWLRTDADGRIDVPVPLAGAWLLRGTEVRADPDQPGRWISGFVTLSFSIDPP